LHSDDGIDVGDVKEGLPFPALRSCGNIQRICCFFDILAGSPGDNATVLLTSTSGTDGQKTNGSMEDDDIVMECTSETKREDPHSVVSPVVGTLEHWMAIHGFVARTRAERLVLAMVWSGFEVKDLDCLPFGIQIPLREALNQCRKTPPARWPADAYVIVDREDIAALVLAPGAPNLAQVWYDEQQMNGEQGSNEVNQNGGDAQNISTHIRQSVFRTPVMAEAVRGKRSETEDPIAMSDEWQTSSTLLAHRESKTQAGVNSSAGSASSSPAGGKPGVTTAVTPMWTRGSAPGSAVNVLSSQLLWERIHEKKKSNSNSNGSIIGMHNTLHHTTPHQSHGRNQQESVMTSSAAEAAAQHLAATGRRSPIANHHQNRFASSDLYTGSGDTAQQTSGTRGNTSGGAISSRRVGFLKFGSSNESLMSVADYALLSASWSASVDSTESGE
jgi:hypothetical protein